MPGSERHLIKKYANRKLYDTRTSRYITLEGISRLVREGAEIEVVDRESGRDLTPLILSQLVTTEEKRGGAAANGGSHRSSAALLDYVRSALNVPAAIVGSEVGKRRGDIESIVDEAIENALRRLSIPTRREIERMEKRLDVLGRRLDTISGEGKRAPRATSRSSRRSSRRKAGA
jgi:hypothetical protein